MESEESIDGVPIEDGSWLVTSGDGLMEACSIAYLFKHLPLRDWLIYCERNGMPGVKGVTDAMPGTTQWEAARQAVQDFGAEFSALMSRGTDIQPIDLTVSGDLPYPQLVERMDRAMATLWRGSELVSLSDGQGLGVTLQTAEQMLIEQDDSSLISETLNAGVDTHVIRYLFGSDIPKAYFRLGQDPEGVLLHPHRLQKLPK